MGRSMRNDSSRTTIAMWTASMTCWASMPTWMNYLASKLDDMSQDEYERFQAAMEIGDHTGSIQELIYLTENLNCYDVYPDIHDHDDLGRYYIEELDAMQVPEHLRNYIDYEAYGRDIALEESGQFTDLGYVRDTGDRFDEVYDRHRESIPWEYRVTVTQEEQEFLDESAKSDMATDLAYDMDEFFRQHDPQYAAGHPEEHAAKEEIYENLMAGRISALETRSWLPWGRSRRTIFLRRLGSSRAPPAMKDFWIWTPR